MQKKSNAAFSLVEMLMALLVASLLLAALAPVITKRAGVESIRVSGSNQSVNPILDEEGFECFNQPNTVVTRSNRVPGVLHVIMVSGGGGGGSASAGSTSSGSILKAGSGNSIQTSSPVIITENMEEVNIANLIGGGAGGGGAASYGTSSQNTSTTGDKKTGPASSLGCPDGSVMNNANDQCVWKPALSLQKLGWPNANSNCTSLTAGGVTAGKWRLPTRVEMTNKWTGSKPGNLENGIYWSNEYIHDTGCSPAGAYRIAYWKSNDWDLSFSADSWGGSCLSYNAYHRCILPSSTIVTIDTTVTQYNTTVSLSSFSAAGGGGAPAITNLKSQNLDVYNKLQTAIKENAGGAIYLSVGNGGQGGSSTTSYSTRGSISSTGNGINGAESCVVVTKTGTTSVTNDSSKIAFKICARGGLAGENRVKSTADGNIATANGAYASGGCYYKIGTGSVQNFNCSGGSKGSNGQANNLQNFTKSSTTAYTYASGTSSTTGGNGGSGTTVSGIEYGKGGNGAGITIKANGGSAANIQTPTVTASTAGNAGYGRVDYTLRYQGSPGAGGAGGTLAVEHINTRGSNIEFQVKVGAGGVGGAGGASVGSANGNPGTAGGNTTFKVIDNTNGGMEVANYTVYGGGGGAAGRNDGVLATGGVPNPAGGLNLTAGSSFTTKNGGFILGIKGDDANNTDKTGGYGGTSGLSAGTTNAPNFRYQGGTSTTGWNGPGWDTTGSVGVPIGGITVDALRGASRDKFPSQAGWGGGGGGFDLSSGLAGVGSGGNGMPGYVCVYWLNGQWE